MTFNSLRVAAFESRRAEELARLIERHGGRPFVSPSLREAPVADHRPVVDFAHRVVTGEIDVVIFTTGVGTRQLVSIVERHVDRQRFLNALRDITTIARGPKPVAALKELGIETTRRVGEPNTWREVLQAIDLGTPIANHTVGVQEYGEPNASLVAGLEARGARVVTVKVYTWELPEDLGPLEANVRRIAEGEVDVVLFTSAHQIDNLFTIAERMRLAAEVRAGLSRLVVASIGPTTSEALRDLGLPVDIEPEHSKMGHLVVAAAERSAALLESKRSGIAAEPRAPGTETTGSSATPRFLLACRREPCDRTPIWLMRQAGRYLPEYRAIRERVTFLELCQDPDLSAEVMIRTVERLGVDAAIIFSDLLPILVPMGFELEYSAGEGPLIHNPLREPGDVDRVRELDSMEGLEFVIETVRRTRAGLPDAIPVIGFAGAPFTLASYAIEGGSSKSFLRTKAFMYRDPGAFAALMGKLARSVALYLNAQIAAGAQAVQIFDSWVGCLGPHDYSWHVLPATRDLIAAVSREAPLIHFGTGNPALLPLMSAAGGDVIGVDWRIDLDEAWSLVGHDKAIQGNLDPAVLLSNPAEIRKQARGVLDQAAGRQGHIFNLGHGVLPQTPVENVLALIEAVRG